MKTGLLFGKFAPLHNGHLHAINRAATFVDELHVVLCYDQKFQDSLSTRLQHKLTLENRLHCLNYEKGMGNISQNVKIFHVDESDIKAYPDGFEDFHKLTLRSTGYDDYDYIFSSEMDYSKYISQEYPHSTHILIDPERKFNPISATDIRNDLLKNFKYLPDSSRVLLSYNFAVIGVESTGKSTSSVSVASMFNTNSIYVEEIGRLICENEFNSSELAMMVSDYEHIAYEHKKAEHKAKSEHPIVISDTNNLITNFSIRCRGMESKILDILCEQESEYYDMVFLLDIDVPWVKDPLRFNGDALIRNNTHYLLIDMCNEFNVKYNLISENGDYTKRIDCVYDHINNYIKNNTK